MRSVRGGRKLGRGPDAINAAPLAAVLLIGLAAALACPIQRPPVPREYYDFRARLERAVQDTAAPLLRRTPEAASTLEANLTLLSSYARVDSVVVSLERESGLEPFARAVDAAVERALGADEVGGSVEDAFEEPDGQRLAVDGIVIGLGRAIRALRRETGTER